MTTSAEDLRRRLVARFGSKIDLEADNAILQAVLDEIGDDLISPTTSAAGYMKTYFKDYDKIGYDRTYQQYDKTVDGVAVLHEIGYSTEVSANFDPDLIKRYEEVKAFISDQGRPFDTQRKGRKGGRD